VVKIYSRKVKYVLSDCNEAITKIKLQAIQSTKVDLPEKTSTVSYATITIPENTTEIELLIPDIGYETFQISDFSKENFENFNDSWDTAKESQNTSVFLINLTIILDKIIIIHRRQKP
jgi:copper chaperone CopZ